MYFLKRSLFVFLSFLMIAVGSVSANESELWKEGFIGVMPSSHQDIAWEDTPDNCDLIREKIFLKALDLLEQNPQYRYMIEDCYITKKFIQLNPDAAARIKRALNKGQLEIGATYTMPNESLFSGEVLTRQFYFGQRWLQDTFEHTSVLSTNVDVPGESMQYPQLAVKAGIKLRILDKNKPFELFRWQSPDGTQIVTEFLPQHNYGSMAAYNPPKPFDLRSIEDLLGWDKKEFYEQVNPVLEKNKLPLAALLYYGSDITFPDERSIQTLHQYGKTHQSPMIEFCSPKEFYEKVKDLPLPVNYGEIPNDWCYMVGPCNAVHMKMARRAQNILPAAEKFSVIANELNPYFNYPAHDLIKAWNKLMDATDHSYSGINGRQTNIIYHTAIEDADQMSQTLLHNAVNDIAGFVKTDKSKKELEPVIVFNSLNWERQMDLAEITVRFVKDKVNTPAIFDGDGNRLRTELIESEKYDDGSVSKVTMLCVVKNIPSIGYTTLYAGQTDNKESDDKAAVWHDNILENDFFRIELCSSGIKSIQDKERNIELIATDNFYGGEFFVGKDTGKYTEPDKLDLTSYFERMKDNPVTISLVRNTALRATVALETSFADSKFREYITLYKDINQIKIDVEVDWAGTRQRQVRMALPFNIKDAQMAYEVPFGVVEIGKNEFPNPEFWQAKKDEPIVEWNPYNTKIYANAHRTSREVQNFFDISGKDIGICINSTVVTHDYRDKTKNPVEYPILQPVLLATKICSGKQIWHEQKGIHNQSFRITTHNPGWKNGYKTGWEFNNPLVAVVPVTNKNALLPQEYSFVTVEPANVIMSTIKKCEDDNSIVMRMFEEEGVDSKVNIRFFRQIRNIGQTSLIERGRQTLDGTEITLGHNEVKTLKFDFEK
ncbi:MAG: hypothetical protein A2Y10_05065 [Planctomycetes bacterium GWF2_41_51]|nr:MAG: hypothetical protein A2Y10_05065 [Planctomycetes bacterium GWF2_41_51]HBG25565.1 hypothetical protein [Phycisphaerales bacterium]